MTSPIKVAGVQVVQSGAVFAVVMETNPGLLPAYLTAVSGVPTFTVNGSVVAVQPAFWASTAFDKPTVFFQPYVPGTPPQAIIIAPTDVVTWTTPDGWCAASQGLAGAESGTAGNYVGGYEPVFFDYLAFQRLPGQQLMGLGVNNTPFASGPSSVVKDATHRSANPWAGATSSTADGYPLTMSAGGLVQGFIWSSALNNGIDSKQVPCPTGLATVTGDEWNPANPMTNGLFTSGPAQPSAITGATAIPGSINGAGHEIGKKWQWTVGKGTSTYNLNLNLQLRAPTGQTANTLHNLKAYLGGDTPVDISGTDASEAFLAMITAPGGNVSPFARYLIDNDGANSQARASDQRPVTDFSYTDPASATNWWTGAPTLTGDRVIPIHSVQPYSVDPSTGHPNVYTEQQYARSVPTDGPNQFRFRLDQLGIAFDWMYPNRVDGAVVLEFVCADTLGNPVAHNLVSGQFVTFAGPYTVACSNLAGTGTATVSNGLQVVIWVTSANTFIAVLVSTCPHSTRMGTASSVQVVDKTCAFRRAGQRLMPVECLTAPCRATNGLHGLYITINHAYDDAAIRALAQHIFDSTPRGTKVYVQWSNEILIPNFQFGWVQQLALLEGLTMVQAVVQRTYECHEIFASVFGVDAGSIVRIFQPFTMNTSNTLQAGQYMQAHSIPMDRIAIAPYIECEVASPTMRRAAAAIIADNPDSFVYAGGQVVPKLSMAGYCDMQRYHFKYMKGWNGPTGLLAQHKANLIASGYGLGGGPSGYRHDRPKFIGYEAGLCTLMPAGLSITSIIPRAGLTHDMSYHPSYDGVLTSYWQSLQQPGATGIEGFAEIAHVNLTQGRAPGGAAYTVVGGPHPGADNGFTQPWGMFMWQNQRPGAGLSNRFWADDGLSHDFENESVMGYSFHAWLDGTPSPPVTPTFQVSPATLQPSQATPVTLTLTGIGTTWTSGSVVSIINSVTGTTTVAGGTFTALSSTSATLAVTTGAGSGTWLLAIDGAASDPQRVGALPSVSLQVRPAQITPGRSTPIVLRLDGIGTSWTSGSTVSITNSVSGTTTVTAGVFTATSATLATLAVTTGAGTGTWRLTIDGTSSVPLTVAARRSGWFNDSSGRGCPG